MTKITSNPFYNLIVLSASAYLFFHFAFTTEDIFIKISFMFIQLNVAISAAERLLEWILNKQK